MDKGIFAGLKVLDCASFIAAPAAATVLSDFGADVIKIEPPGTGDPYRNLPNLPGYPSGEHNFAWLLEARNKKSIALDLAKPEAQAVLYKLVAEADVFITNMPPPVRAKLGITYDHLSHLNERLIYASFTGYGETGPEANKPGFDATAWWARTGLMDLVRAGEEVPPARSLPGMGDHPTAVTMYAMIVTALLRRERTGKGTRVHTSLLANGAWANGCYVQAALAGGTFERREGTPPDPISPNRVLFETSDGRLLQLYMIRTHEELDGLLIAAGRPDLLVDERFAAPAERAANMRAFIAELHAMFATRTASEWLSVFGQTGVNVTPVAQMEDIPTDGQLLASGALVTPSDPSVEMPLILNHPLHIDGLQFVGPRRAPSLGEHTAEILAELGMSTDSIADFQSRGIV